MRITKNFDQFRVSRHARAQNITFLLIGKFEFWIIVRNHQLLSPLYHGLFVDGKCLRQSVKPTKQCFCLLVAGGGGGGGGGCDNSYLSLTLVNLTDNEGWPFSHRSVQAEILSDWQRWANLGWNANEETLSDGCGWLAVLQSLSGWFNLTVGLQRKWDGAMANTAFWLTDWLADWGIKFKYKPPLWKWDSIKRLVRGPFLAPNKSFRNVSPCITIK